MSLGFANIIETHSGSQKIFPIKLKISLSSKGEERKEQTRRNDKNGKEKKSRVMISKVIISDVEKKKSQNWAGEFWMQEEKKKGDTSRRHEGHAKWKTDCSFVDTQALKTYLSH